MENYELINIIDKLPSENGYYYTNKGLLFFNIENKNWYLKENDSNLIDNNDIHNWFEKINENNYFTLIESFELITFILRLSGNPLLYQNIINHFLKKKLNKFNLKFFVISKKEKDFKDHKEFINKLFKTK
jgi:hypothetical protein